MKRKKTFRAILIAIAAAAFVAAGLSRVLVVYRNYRSDMLQNESRHLNSIVTSSARGLDWQLDGYMTQLQLLTERSEFLRAEEEFAATGDVVVMRKLMLRPDVLNVYMGYSLAVYDAGGGFLAATDSLCPRRSGGDEALGSGILLREAEDGSFWFVFGKTSDAGDLFELCVPVQTVFAAQSESVRVGRHGYLFLVDKDGRSISYAGGGQRGTLNLEALAEAQPAVRLDALTELAQRGPTLPEEYLVYRFPWGEVLGSPFADTETLVVTAPVMRAGTELTVGAAVSFEEFDSFLTDTLHQVAWVILLEIAGALLLFYLAARAMVESRRNALELQAVRERADLMEEINRQQQSLEHTERLQQLGVMTGGVIHEFNNMLTPIMSQSMLLLEQLAEQEDSPQFESALDIYEASENAREMLRRMSSMSKKDVDMSFAAVELGELLRRTMGLVSMAKDPHIRQELRVPDGPLYVEGIPQLLTQAFLNLCINACQAMGSEGTLRVSLAEETRAGHRYARVTVSDTGPGIPEKWLSSIYDSYFTTKGEQGTGLGLAICQKIVQTHKGTIVAANAEGGGAVFTVRIPLRDEPAEEE